MFEIEQVLKGKKLKTKFLLNEEQSRWAKEVLALLEDKKIHVPYYKNFEKNLKPICKPVSIKKLLPLVIEKVGIADIDSLGIFRNKERTPFDVAWAFQNLYSENECPFHLDFYAGAVALKKEIIQSKECFCYTLAHELLHAIELLPHVYPALTDWSSFFSMVKECKSHGLEYPGVKYCCDLGLDSFMEYDTMEDFFGAIIGEWIDEEWAFLKENDGLLKEDPYGEKNSKFLLKQLPWIFN